MSVTVNLMNKMSRKITEEERKWIISLWLECKIIREIRAITGRSDGAISGIINEEKKRVPDLVTLRELNKALKKANSNVLDAHKGAVFHERIGELNISMDRIPECVDLLRQYGEEARDVLAWGVRLRKLEAAEGKTRELIVKEAEEKASNARKWDDHIGRLKLQEKSIKESIRELEPLKALQDKLDRHNITPAKIDSFIEKQIRLEELGFTPKSAEVLSSKLAEAGLEPQLAANKVVNLLARHVTLEGSVENLHGEQRRIKQEIISREEELDGLNEDLNLKKKEIANLEDQIDRAKKELQSTQNQIREDEQELKLTKDRLNEAENTLSKIQRDFQNITPLTTLIGLIQTPKARLNPSIVMETVLGVVEGFRKYLTENPYELNVIDYLSKADLDMQDIMFPQFRRRWEVKRQPLSSHELMDHLEKIGYTLTERLRHAARQAQ